MRLFRSNLRKGEGASKGLLSVCVLMCLITLTGCSLQSVAGSGAAGFHEIACLSPKSSPSLRPIFVVNQGWHSGIVLSRDDLGSSLRDSLPETQTSEWLEFGWGDRDFYLSSGYSYWQAFRAAFFSSATVLQVSGLPTLPHDFFKHSEVFQIVLTEEGIASLNQTIESTLVRDEKGRLKRVAKSLYGDGSFYEAVGDFSFLHTCNSWTSEALAQAGCSITPGLLRSSSVSSELRALESKALRNLESNPPK